ncbi:hypothetical protein RJ640_003499, partial [Escallonia rubra]
GKGLFGGFTIFSRDKAFLDTIEVSPEINKSNSFEGEIFVDYNFNTDMPFLEAFVGIMARGEIIIPPSPKLTSETNNKVSGYGGFIFSGKMKEAQEFLEEMSSKGFNPPVRGRDLLIDGLLNAGYLESAKALVRKMTKEGFVPDVGIFNSLTEAVCKSGEVDFCISLYNDVCRLGLCPDIETGGEFEEKAAGSGEEG